MISESSNIYEIFSQIEMAGIFSFDELMNYFEKYLENAAPILHYLTETFGLLNSPISQDQKDQICQILREKNPEEWKELILNVVKERAKEQNVYDVFGQMEDLEIFTFKELTDVFCNFLGKNKFNFEISIDS